MDLDQQAKLTEVFRTVFNDPDLEPHEEMTAQDVPDWDSFNHVYLITMIEEQFSVSLTTKEVSRFQNVGDLIQLLDSKLN